MIKITNLFGKPVDGFCWHEQSFKCTCIQTAQLCKETDPRWIAVKSACFWHVEQAMYNTLLLQCSHKTCGPSSDLHKHKPSPIAIF